MLKHTLSLQIGILLAIQPLFDACQSKSVAATVVSDEQPKASVLSNEVTDEKVWADAAKYDIRYSFSQTAREKLMLREINMVRANPKAYIELVQIYINNQQRGTPVPRVPTISSSTTIRNGIKTTKRDTTWSGGGFSKNNVNQKAVSAAKELIGELQKLKALPMLTPTECLTKSAKNQGGYCKSLAKLTHSSRDGKPLNERLGQFCSKLTAGSENLCAGSAAVRESMMQLLVDVNVPNRGHRRNLLSADYTLVGVYEIGAFGPYNTGWVQEFGTK